MTTPEDSLKNISFEDNQTVQDLVTLGQIAAQVYENSIKVTVLREGKFSQEVTQMANVGNRDTLFNELVKAYLRNPRGKTVKGGSC